MLVAGVDVVRLNFSHGTAARPPWTVPKPCARPHRSSGATVAVMADLQGPKIRVGKFADGKVMLSRGRAFVLDAEAHRAR